MLKYYDGITYWGNFERGLRNGRGKLKSDKEEFIGMFSEDRIVGPNWKDLLEP